VQRYRLPCYICQAEAITGAYSGPSVSHACTQSCIVACILRPDMSCQRCLAQVQPVKNSNMCCLVMPLYCCIVYAAWHMCGFACIMTKLLRSLFTRTCWLAGACAAEKQMKPCVRCSACQITALTSTFHTSLPVLTAGNAHPGSRT